MKLVYNEVDTKKISEVFGWNEKQYKDIARGISRYLLMADGQSITAGFKEYLESDFFKKLGYSIETENDYFMLGYAFNSALDATRSLMSKITKGQVEVQVVDSESDTKEKIKAIVEKLLNE